MAPYPDGGPLYIVSTPYMYLLYEFPPKELSTFLVAAAAAGPSILSPP